MKEDLIYKLNEVFRAVFQLPSDADVSKLHRDGAPKWDSLTFVTLIAAIESEFQCQIDITDALCLASYEDARAIIERKCA